MAEQYAAGRAQFSGLTLEPAPLRKSRSGKNCAAAVSEARASTPDCSKNGLPTEKRLQEVRLADEAAALAARGCLGTRD